jgi:hypothetical protein
VSWIGRDGAIWYYEQLLGVFAARLGETNPLTIELRTAVTEMSR